MKEKTTHDPASSQALAAVAALADYLFAGIRQRDGVAAPPLFDRRDFVEFVEERLGAPAAQWTDQEREGQAWLANYVRRLL